MEGREGEGGGVPATGEDPSHGGETSSAPPPSEATPAIRKKRGRPRKYGSDGSLVSPLSPEPISASAPTAAMKRGRGRSRGSSIQRLPWSLPIDTSDESVACSAGANFTPHTITVPAGEDVTMKIISFSQQGPRGICILSANGVISNVTLRQPDSSGGTMTYEGRFELLSLSGSFMPTDIGGSRSRSGGMSVSLASPDGRVVGGGVAGLLVAASPVQVVIGSFIPNLQIEQKMKKPRVSPSPIPAPLTQGQSSAATSSSSPPGASFVPRESSSSPLKPPPESRDSTAGVNVPPPGD
ncbi:AT-hook motif nuclear-localized protein 1-like [Wolffia australiana]